MIATYRALDPAARNVLGAGILVVLCVVLFLIADAVTHSAVLQLLAVAVGALGVVLVERNARNVVPE